MLHLYGSPLSLPTNKIRYVANFLHIPYEFHLTNLGSCERFKSQTLIMRPYEKIPMIQDDEFKLAESNAIIRYLASKQKASIYPQELKQRAEVDQWLDYLSHHISAAITNIMFNTYFYKIFSKIQSDQHALQDGYRFLAEYFPVLEEQLATYKYLASNEITLADFSLLATIDICELIELDLSIFPNLKKWRNGLMQDSFYRDCHENYAEMFNFYLNEVNVENS